MQFGPARRQLLAQRGQQRAGGLLDQHHIEAQRAATRGDLGTDEPTSDHHDPGTRAQSFPNGQAVLDRTQHQHPVRYLAARPFTWDRAIGDHQSVERQGQLLVLVAHVDRARSRDSSGFAARQPSAVTSFSKAQSLRTEGDKRS